MSRFLLIFVLLLIFHCTDSLSQNLKLELRLENSQSEFLYITFFENGNSISDTLKKSENGYYYLTSFRIKSPQITRISSSSVTINNIFVAPGYDLVISGDANSDFYALNKNIHISGIGEKANYYNHMRDSFWETRPINGISPYGKDEYSFLNSLTEMRRLSDTLLERYQVLDSQNIFHAYFVRLKKIDNRFDQFSYLLGFAKNFNKDPKYGLKLLKNYAHFDQLKDINDSLLISASFREFITYHYLNVVTNVENHSDSIKDHKLFSRFDMANEIYSGEVKQYALGNIMEDIIGSITNIDDLIFMQDDFFQRVNYLLSSSSKAELINYYNLRKSELNSFVAGKNSPLFIGSDINDKQHNSKELIAKVLYIDLWGTWCGACLSENKYLDRLYQNYKDNSDFAIISIAIADHLPTWKSFLVNQNQNARWNQWFDTDAKTRDLFYGTLALPKFIIIDKDGKIADFNAPPPSENDQLKTILNKLLNKSLIK